MSEKPPYRDRDAPGRRTGRIGFRLLATGVSTLLSVDLLTAFTIARGLRDCDYPYAKPHGTERILVLGNLDDRFVARGIGRKQLTVGNAGPHWNAYGHHLAAEELEAYLVEESLVPAG